MAKGLKSVPTLSAKEIAAKHGVSLTYIVKQIAKGVKVEKEHTKSTTEANEIARDHLGERPDYYAKLDKMEKSKVSVKEETGVGSVRGLGNVTGDPAGTNYVQQYVDTNSMAYQDENGNKLEWIKKKHNKLHGKLGFNSFDPSNIDNNKNFVNEGISAGPERASDYSIGDPSGGRTLYRPLEVKEGAKLDKAKKALKVGAVFANIATAGHVAGSAAEGRGSPKHDIVRAATTLPGPTGLAAKGINYAKMAYGKYKQMKEDKDPCWKGYEMVGMKKKGGRKVPNCVPVKESGQVMSRYTERPTYEGKSMGETLPKAGGVARGIYQEGYASIGHAYDWAGDVNSKAKFYGKKPKATDTKSDEKDDTYKDSNKGKKVKFAKTVKEEQIDEFLSPVSLIAGLVQDKLSGQSARDKEIKDLKTNINQKRKIDSVMQNSEWPNSRIDEIKASTVGRAVAKAAAERKELTSKKMGDKDIKQWWKRERLVRRGTEKLTGKSKVPASTEDSPPFFPSHERSHKKGSKLAHLLAVKAMKKQKSQLKEELMDTRDLIQEAIGNIMEENLHEMKDNLLAALQEKTMEKLEERKKEIAANYFAQ